MALADDVERVATGALTDDVLTAVKYVLEKSKTIFKPWLLNTNNFVEYRNPWWRIGEELKTVITKSSLHLVLSLSLLWQVLFEGLFNFCQNLQHTLPLFLMLLGVFDCLKCPNIEQMIWHFVTLNTTMPGSWYIPSVIGEISSLWSNC